MAEHDEFESIMPNCATEVLIHIFSFLKPTQLFKCRQVCSRWKRIVDDLVTKQHFWRISCQRDFPDIYISAYRKRKSGLTWRNLYRSLSLWSQLHNCTVTQDEFVSASCSTHEICDFHLLKDAEIGIHNEKAIIYYDVNTLKQTNRPVLSGHYYRYFENNDVILVLGTTSHLYVIRKVLRTPLQADTIFPSVKTFLVNENVVYFATRENKIHICDLLQDEIKSCVLGQIPDHVECFGYKNDLHILTYERNIYTIIGTEIIFQRNIDDAPNLLHMLNQYNFLENLDFGMYYHWMFILEHHIPRDSLRKIFVVKVYGDMVFVGSNSGDLKIYHSPYLNNELDLFNTEPVKQYNLGSYNNDRPGLSSRPIIKIDVIEGEDSHTVIVGMPHKIAVLNFNHYFESNFNKCLQSIEY